MNTIAAMTTITALSFRVGQRADTARRAAVIMFDLPGATVAVTPGSELETALRALVSNGCVVKVKDIACVYTLAIAADGALVWNATRAWSKTRLDYTRVQVILA